MFMGQAKQLKKTKITLTKGGTLAPNSGFHPTHLINLNSNSLGTTQGISETNKKNSQSTVSINKISKLKIQNANKALYSTMPPAMPSENSEQYVPLPTQTTSERDPL